MHQAPWAVIQSLEATNSRLDKESIIRQQAVQGNDEFFRGLAAATNKLITFGVKKVPVKKSQDGCGLDVNQFWSAIERLSNRSLSGNAAIDEINRLMGHATQIEWNYWYRRILIKDLRCGVNEKTINNVVSEKFTEYSVPVFGCQLAQDGADDTHSGVKQIEIKLDGVRVLTVVTPEGEVTQYSRNGKELVNFTKIKEFFAERAASLSEPMVFDGEVISKTFQKLMTQVNRKSNVQTDDAVLMLFDLIPLSDFLNGHCAAKQVDRYDKLEHWYSTNKSNIVQCIDKEIVDFDTAEGQLRFSEINREAILNGFEGIMIKDIDAPYECKRSKNWKKVKPVISVTLRIDDIEEGTGRNEGRLGAFVCSGIDDGKEIHTNVGSGFSDSQREDYWSSRKTLIGDLAEIEADAITQNQNGTYSLRFPRFKCFRNINDSTTKV